VAATAMTMQHNATTNEYLANRLQSKAIGSIFDRNRAATSGEIFL
jgi:hypothetical protein